MNTPSTVSYTWIFWSGAAFLFFAQIPRSRRTALAPFPRFLAAMSPIMAIGCAFTFAYLLGLALFQAPTHTGQPWRTPLIFLTATGIAIIPLVFQSQFLRTVRPHSLAHFLTGIAFAACWPGALTAASHGNPTLILLGAVSGLLPDTLDHWVARFLHRPDIHVVPDPLAPDPSIIANALTTALARSHERQATVHVEFYPVEIQANRWQPYKLSLAPNCNSRRPGRHLPPSVPAKTSVITECATDILISVGNAVIAAPSPAPLTTDHTFTVKIHNEPISLAVAPTDDGRIILRVVPWQQQWSHSLTIAIVLGMLAGIVWGVPAGLVAGGAYALHLVTDQLGFTGSNLFFPFTRHRASGFQILHPGQATVFYIGVAWLAMLLTGWNWARTVLMLNPLPALIPTLLFAGALPMAGIVWLIKRTRMIH